MLGAQLRERGEGKHQVATIIERPTPNALRSIDCKRGLHDWTLRLDPRGYRYAIWFCRAECGVDERPLVSAAAPLG